MPVGEATTVKDSASAAPSPSSTGGTGTPASSGPTTARAAIEKAFTAEAQPPSSSGTPAGEAPKPIEGVTTPPAGDGVETPPAEGVASAAPGQQPTPPAQTAESVGIANLRAQYEALKRQYAPLEGMDIDEIRQWMAERARFRADPVAWYRQLGTELGGHEQFRSAMQPPAKPEPEPQPDLYAMVDGEKVYSYSAGQLKKWHEWNNRQTQAMIEERLNPMQRWVSQAERTTRDNQIMASSRSTAAEVLGEMRTYPHFKEGEAKIAERLASIPKAVRQKVGAIAALHMAYAAYLKHDVMPNRDAEVRKQVEADARRKAAASTGSVAPGGGQQTGTGKRPMNQKELADKLRSGAYANQ